MPSLVRRWVYLLAGGLAACSPQSETGQAQANVFLEDVVKSPEERCAEARAIADDLVRSDPDEETRWRALAAAACAQVILGQ